MGIQTNNPIQNFVHEFQKGAIILVGAGEFVPGYGRLDENISQVQIGKAWIFLNENNVVMDKRMVNRVAVRH